MLKRLTLSGNALKIIACVSMFIDHVGVMLYPEITWLRYVGRLAFPIFAFLIAEGCRYTKNKLKYFLTVFILGVVCQLVFNVVYQNKIYLGILLTFSLSIILIYLLENLKKAIIEKAKLQFIFFYALLFIGFLFFCYFVTLKVTFDYGFIGVTLPLICALFDYRKFNLVKRSLIVKKLCFLVGIIVYYLLSENKAFTVSALLTIPLIFIYNGERGKLNLKYLFYLFYPLHFIVIYLISIII